MANSSFYANGLPYGTDETGVGNVPSGPDGPKTAESSFYLSGGRYSTEGVGVGNVPVDPQPPQAPSTLTASPTGPTRPAWAMSR